MANASSRFSVPFLTLACLPLAGLGCSSSNGVEGDSAATGGGTNYNVSSTGGSGYVARTGTATDTASSTNTAASTGTDTSTNTNIATGCSQQSVPIQALPPDILIIQDRSQSMTDDSNDQPCSGGSRFGGGNCGANSKWSQVTTAIESVVNATSSVNWGLFYFGNGISECGTNTAPDVPVSANSAGQIVASLTANSPGGATPTAVTVNNAVAYMQTLTDPNPKFLLLATDGEPNCLNGNVNSTDEAGATAAVANAKAAGFPTFVVGIGTVTSATAALNGMAQAGGEPQAGATAYYAVSDTAGLEATLNQIVGLAASCTISLQNVPQGDWTIAIWATDSSGKTIQIPNSASDGWAYTDISRSSITLVGPTCDNLMNDTYSNLQFVYTCQNQTIAPPIN
jgi:hypothetical protein